jgi:hypothetical protein
MLFCRHYSCLLNTFMRKGKDPDPDGPKTCGPCGSESGSPTQREVVVTFELLCLCLDGELYEVLAGGVLLPLVVLPAHSILHLLTHTVSHFFLKCCLVLCI